jgi:hypothetical protein
MSKQEAENIVAQILRMPNETPQSLQTAVLRAHQKVREARKTALVDRLVELRYMAGTFYDDEKQPQADETAGQVFETPVSDDDAKAEWLKTHKDMRGFALAMKKKKKPVQAATPTQPVVSSTSMKEEEKQALIRQNKQRRVAAMTQQSDGWEEHVPGVVSRVGRMRDDDRSDPRSGATSMAQLEAGHEAAKSNRREGGVNINQDVLDRMESMIDDKEE